MRSSAHGRLFSHAPFKTGIAKARPAGIAQRTKTPTRFARAGVESSLGVGRAGLPDVRMR